MSESGEQNRKLFLGGLNYNTTEDGLKNYFQKFGDLTDVVVMRFPDTKRSRGFGFVTFATEDQAEACFSEQPHTIDDTSIETKRATPKEEMKKGGGEEEELDENSETYRKLFIGGLSYETTDEGLKKYFEKYGEIVDSVVMKFRDTKRSRGFGFVTYSDASMVDAVQADRPHTVEGAKVETKRATPREELGKGESGLTVKKVFVGGIKDGLENDDMKEYFSQFGNVTRVEHMTCKNSGRKRGFGFVEFDDYDAVDKIVLKGKHEINGFKVDVKKAVSKTDMRNGDGGGGRGGPGPRGDRRGGGGPAPWGGNAGFGGGYERGGGYGGGNFGGGGGYGGGNFGGGGGYGGGFGGGGGGWGQGGNQGSNPWQGGGGAGSWEDQGSGWGQGGGGAGGGGGGWGQGGNQGGYAGGYGGGRGGGQMGGPMRNSMGGANRSAPYNVGGNRGGAGGGFGGGAGGYGGGYQRGGGGGQRW